MSTDPQHLPSTVDNSEAMSRRRAEQPVEEKPKSILEQEGDMVRRQSEGLKPRPKVTRSLDPFDDRILVRRAEAEAFAGESGTILTPEEHRKLPNEGVVVAHGAGRWLPNGDFRKMQVQAGDIVLFGKYAGQEIELNGSRFVVLREEELIGRITETPLAE